MKNRKWWTYGFVVLIAVGAYFINVEVQSHLGRKAVEGLDFEVHDLNGAFTRAKAESKMVLAGLSAVWCPSCRKLDKQVLANVDVSKHIREQFVFARVEYESEEGEAFMKRYNVQGFPNLLVLDADGNLVKKLAVTFNPGQFLKSLDL